MKKRFPFDLIIVAGIVIGVLAAILQRTGNPGNMGFCVACMIRDISGALGWHRAAVVQYIRPEIIGIILGAAIAAVLGREFRPRVGSAPLIRFLLGMIAMIGALVFLGCPWRAYLRLAGGDLTAVAGILGIVTGVVIGIRFLASGYSLGRSRPGRTTEGVIAVAFAVLLLILVIVVPQFGVTADGDPAGPIFVSTSGPGSMAAPLLLSLGAGLLVGILAQRTRFCTVGALRDVILIRDFRLLGGVVALIVSAFVLNLIFGQFQLAMEGQPIAHTNHLWNWLGMTVAGLAFILAGGCPGRQLVLAGEGDADSALFVLGMLTGAAVAHTFVLASSPAGVTTWGPAAVVIGLVICLAIGFGYRE